MGKELLTMNNYTWHILFRVLTTTAQPGQDTIFKYSRWLILLLPPLYYCTKYSVHNRSGIIAQHGVSNAKLSMVDLILRLPETNFW